MALIPVRDPHTGAIHEVTEAWLERWPDDFERIEGDELARHLLRAAGIGPDELDAALACVTALVQPDTDGEHEEQGTGEEPVVAPAGAAAAVEVPSTAKHAAPVDPAVSSF